MSIPFDTLTFVQPLERVGVGRQVAETHAELTRDVVLAEVATKAELTAQLTRIAEKLIARIESAEHRLTIKAGAMIVTAVGVLVAAQRLL